MIQIEIYYCLKFMQIKLKTFREKNIDYIFVHQCSLISYLETDLPIFIWTDLTFDLFYKTYFKKYKQFSSNSIITGNKLEKMALLKAKKYFILLSM